MYKTEKLMGLMRWALAGLILAFALMTWGLMAPTTAKELDEPQSVASEQIDNYAFDADTMNYLARFMDPELMKAAGEDLGDSYTARDFIRTYCEMDPSFDLAALMDAYQVH